MAIGLEGQSVLVVGAAGGIGRVTADAFARAGARVVAAGRPGAHLMPRRRPSAPRPPLWISPTMQPSKRSSRIANPSTTWWWRLLPRRRIGRNALGQGCPHVHDSKFFGAYRIARAAKIRDNGSLTFVSGFLSTRPSANSVLQGAINAALEALARGLALERAPVRVNTVSPGLIDTPLYAGMRVDERDAILARIADKLPARRIGQPSNIAEAILFVATNPFATGSTVTVDGGGIIV